MGRQNIHLHKPSLLERFGLFYLGKFKSTENGGDIFLQSDADIKKQIYKSKKNALWLTMIVSVASTLPIVWVDMAYEDSDFLKHYGFLFLTITLSVIIELYILFVIALKLVHDLKNHLQVRNHNNDSLFQGAFDIKNILARTALELPDPELKIMGIDPFQRISKKNLLFVSLIYKAKIMVTNILLKYSLLFLIGKNFFGVSILYEAVLVECFWNFIIVHRITKEARLRLFGFVLAHKIATDIQEKYLVSGFSTNMQVVCLRAIGNAVVMTQNYHPNMIILLTRFREMIPDSATEKLDDWDLFISEIAALPEKEQFFILDLFTIATAFDGKISRLEKKHLQEVYQIHSDRYKLRLSRLIFHLQRGRLNAAYGECALDFEVG
jgi:hypothetical protein